MSYSDMMAGVLMIFILMVIITINDYNTKEQLLEESKQRLEQSIAQQAAAERGLAQLHDNIGEVLGVRAALLKRLKERLNASGVNVVFDDATGAVRLEGNVLFEEGSAKLSAEGKRQLDALMPVYFDALLRDEALSASVDSITIEGHTNSNYSGSSSEFDAYLFNLNLSQERAYAAMKYVVSSPASARWKPMQYLAANGYAGTRPIKREDGSEDKAMSRRIEIRFRLKDEEALRRLQLMLSKDEP
jgi:chemotaxis protein MotB